MSNIAWSVNNHKPYFGHSSAVFELNFWLKTYQFRVIEMTACEVYWVYRPIFTKELLTSLAFLKAWTVLVGPPSFVMDWMDDVNEDRFVCSEKSKITVALKL